MTRKARAFPLLPTLFVGGATAVMIWLGMWQVQRLHAKTDELAQFARAAAQPPVAFPPRYDRTSAKSFAFRRGTGTCAQVIGWSAFAGSNVQGAAGYSHIAECATPDPRAMHIAVDIGWSRNPRHPQWRGGVVSGLISADRAHILKLIADTPASGLEPSAQPKLEDAGNPYQGAYWWVWFSFAAMAPVMYLLALRRRAG